MGGCGWLWRFLYTCIVCCYCFVCFVWVLNNFDLPKSSNLLLGWTVTVGQSYDIYLYYYALYSIWYCSSCLSCLQINSYAYYHVYSTLIYSIHVCEHEYMHMRDAANKSKRFHIMIMKCRSYGQKTSVSFVDLSSGHFEGPQHHLWRIDICSMFVVVYNRRTCVLIW